MHFSCYLWKTIIFVRKVSMVWDTSMHVLCISDDLIGASFAENFYGLKRRKRPLFETQRARAAVGGIFPEEKLRNREIWWSLLFLVSKAYLSWRTTNTVIWILQVAVPYLRAKAQDYFEELGGGVDSEVLEGSGHSRQAHDDQVHEIQLLWLLS